MADAFRVAVIGEEHIVDGYRLAGATVMVASDADGARRAWDALPGDTGVVLLTERAARALEDRLADPGRMTAVIPA